MIRKICLLAAFLLSACAGAPEPAQEPVYRFAAGRDHVGRLYHYVRSNRDGSRPEHIYVFHSRSDFVEVYKMVEKCTNAAYVTAALDRNIWSATKLVGGRLGRNAEQLAFATMTLDRDARRIDAVVTLPDQTLTDSLELHSLPWRLYDFDFADFTILAQHLADYKQGFSVEMALVIADPERPKFLQSLGVAKIVAEGLDAQRSAWRYRLEGEAFVGGGSLLLDATDGHVIEVETAVPNHAEYDDFKLTLADFSDGGEVAWRALLLSHFEGCETD